MKKNLLTLMLVTSCCMLTSRAQNAPIDLYRAGLPTQMTEMYDTPLQTTGNKAVLTEVTTDSPYEGTTHYQIDYISPSGWWAGNGAFNLNNYTFGTKQNYSNHTHLRIAYKGTGTAANSLIFWFTDSTFANGTAAPYRNGPEVTVATISTDYQIHDIPLSSFVGTSGLDLTNLHTLNWAVGLGAETTTGTFYIDNIQIVDGTTATKDKFESINVSIGPNPSSGIFTINSQENIDAVIVTDYLGNVVSNTADLQVDLTNEADGLYFLTVISGEKRAIKKLVKK